MVMLPIYNDCRSLIYLYWVIAASDAMAYLCNINLKNELVSHNYVTTFMKIKGSPLSDAISWDGDYLWFHTNTPELSGCIISSRQALQKISSKVSVYAKGGRVCTIRWYDVYLTMVWRIPYCGTSRTTVRYSSYQSMVLIWYMYAVDCELVVWLLL